MKNQENSLYSDDQWRIEKIYEIGKQLVNGENYYMIVRLQSQKGVVGIYEIKAFKPFHVME